MRPDLKALLKRLLESEVDFVLVGGFAAMVHGSPLVTQDVDVCLRFDDEQVLKLRRALKDISPKHRMNPGFKPSFLDYPQSFAGVNNIYLETDLGVLDAMSELRPIGGFERIKSKALKIQLYGFECHVVSLEDLLAIKETMSRPRDMETVLYLKEILQQTRQFDNSYWDQKWLEGDIRFNQPKPNYFLTTHFGRLVPDPTTVFVPLCGKSIDMEWLCAQGHEVVGVESNEGACKSFFEERGLSFQSSQSDKFATFRSGRYTLHCGNFFDLERRHLAGAGVAYDRAALVALPPEIRKKYFAHVAYLLGVSASIFLICGEYLQTEVKPPPFAVLEEEVRGLAVQFAVKVLETQTPDPKQLKNPKFRQVTAYSDKAYWVSHQ